VGKVVPKLQQVIIIITRNKMADQPIVPVEEKKKEEFVSGGWKNIPGNVPGEIPDRMQTRVNEVSEKIPMKPGVILPPTIEAGGVIEPTGKEIPFSESLVGKGVSAVAGAAKSAYGTYSDISKMNTPGYQGEFSGALAANPTNTRNLGPMEERITPTAPGVLQFGDRGVIGGPEEASKAPPITRTHMDEQGIVQVGGTPPDQGPMKATVSSPGWRPGEGIVPSAGGGVGGFVDSEMKKIEKDRAEYDQYLRTKEEEKLAGLGPEGEAKMKKRIRDLEPYLEGVSKGRKAKIMSGFMGKLIEEEGAGSRALLKGRQDKEAAMGAATVKADAVRTAAYQKAQTEAAKYGIDIAKLGLQEKDLGLKAAEVGERVKLWQAQIKQYGDKTAIDAVNLQLRAAENETQKNKIRSDFFQKMSSDIYDKRMAGIQKKYEFNMNSPEAKREELEATRDRISGAQMAVVMNPYEGAATMGAHYTGGKWIMDEEVVNQGK
jgi:hypothetical protein